MTSLSQAQSLAFSTRILSWFDRFGRHHLPWQQQPNAYRVWLSEIMLQQTQVVTVIGYYERFLTSFPTVESLAKASEDDVLALWSGLGYYARARNLHKTAKIVCTEFEGEFPTDLESMQSLPGIGRSTAAAILTFALQQSHAILDGNVKRVLARHYEIEGWSGTSSTLKQLWHLSDVLTPKTKTAQFNQAMMDMGATVCTRSKPKCTDCCINKTCLAFKNDSWSRYPNSKPKKKNPLKQAYLVMLINGNAVHLEKRVSSGIWGGLWSLPEFTDKEDASNWVKEQVASFDKNNEMTFERELLHRFSHYDFMIHLLVYKTDSLVNQVNEKEDAMMTQKEIAQVGLPTPIKTVLDKYFY